MNVSDTLATTIAHYRDAATRAAAPLNSDLATLATEIRDHLAANGSTSNFPINPTFPIWRHWARVTAETLPSTTSDDTRQTLIDFADLLDQLWLDAAPLAEAIDASTQSN